MVRVKVAFALDFSLGLHKLWQNNGVNVNEFERTISSYYFATLAKNKKHLNFQGTEAERFLFNRGFYLGAQWSARTSTDLSPHIAKFIEFMVWLTADELPDNAA